MSHLSDGGGKQQGALLDAPDAASIQSARTACHTFAVKVGTQLDSDRQAQLTGVTRPHEEITLYDISLVVFSLIYIACRMLYCPKNLKSA